MFDLGEDKRNETCSNELEIVSKLQKHIEMLIEKANDNKSEVSQH